MEELDVGMQSLLRLINAMEMDPHGLFTGLLGVLASVVFVNGKSLSFGKVMLLSVIAIILSGYTMPVIESQVNSRPWSHVLNAGVAFLDIEGFQFLKTKGPAILQFVSDRVSSIAGKFFSTPTPPKK